MIDAGELSNISGMSIRESRKVITIVQKEMKDKGYYIPKSKKLIAPTELVLEKIGVKQWN